MASALATYVTEPRKVHTVTTSMRMLPQSKGSLKAAGLAGDGFGATHLAGSDPALFDLVDFGFPAHRVRGLLRCLSA